MTLCFIGGGRLKEFHDVLLPYVDEDDKVLIIPFATEETKYTRWLKNANSFFSALGISDTNILSIQDSPRHSIEKIESSNILFFTGGRPEKLIAHLNEKSLIDVIKKHDGLLIGYSAGALAFSYDCIITKDDDYPETQLIRGIGIVDFSVDVHYTPVIDHDLLKLSNQRIIYAIPEKCMLIWDGHQFISNDELFCFHNETKVAALMK